MAKCSLKTLTTVDKQWVQTTVLKMFTTVQYEVHRQEIGVILWDSNLHDEALSHLWPVELV